MGPVGMSLRLADDASPFAAEQERVVCLRATTLEVHVDGTAVRCKPVLQPHVVQDFPHLQVQRGLAHAGMLRSRKISPTRCADLATTCTIALCAAD